MPGMDGLELQARLNQLGITLPVIVMTGQGDVQTAVQAMKAGAVDFIEKPFDEEVLLRAIEVALARRAGRTGLARPPRLLTGSRRSVRVSGRFLTPWLRVDRTSRLLSTSASACARLRSIAPA